jgi:hypothetical protein
VGTFPFEEGSDHFVDLVVANSVGEVVADALVFKRVEAKAKSNHE